MGDRSTAVSAARLRSARPSDRPALWALEQASFDSDRLRPRQLRYHLGSPRAEVVVAVQGGHLVGYALALYRADSPWARVYSLAVAEAARGQRLGERLVRRLMAGARRRNAIGLRLEVAVDNHTAQALYRRLGFAPVRRLSGYYQDGRDGERWQRRF